MFVDFHILNELGSPSINSNTFANRPTAGQIGRLFVSTDTYEIYRDNGSTWDLIGGPGSSTVTGTGAATQVAYWTASQAIGGSNNLWWDNTNGYLGVKTNTPTAGVNVVQTDGQAILSDFTTVAGSGNNAVAIYGRNTTNSSGYVAVLEEKTPNSSAGQYPIKIMHSLSSGTAAANMATGIHFSLPDDAGTERINQLSMDTVDPAAATYTSRYRFVLRNAGAAATPFYVTAAGLGVYVASPSGLIHADGGASAARMILDADAGVARIFSFRSDNLPRWAFRVDGAESGSNAGADLAVRAYNDAGAFTFAPLTIARATGKANWQATEAYSTGLARGNYFDYNLSVAAGGSFSSPNAISALGASLDLTLAGNATIPDSARSGLDAYNTVSFTGTGTLTQSQGTKIRAYSNLTTGWAFNGSATGTITHLAGLRVLFPDNSGSAVTVTNNYGLLINDQTANTGTVTYTNRWGIYQEGASDLNYMAANLLLGSTTNNGNKLQVTGVISIENTAQLMSFRRAASERWRFDTNSSNDFITTGLTSGGTFYIFNNTSVETFSINTTRAFLGVNTGIGTSSPADLIDITRSSSSNSTGGLTLTNTDNSGYGSSVSWNLKLNSVAGVWGRIAVEAATSTSTYMPFFTTIGSALGERMRINSSGDLLINSTSSILSGTNNQVLNLNATSSAYIGLSTGATLRGYIYADSSTTGIGSYTNIPFTFITNNTEKARFTAGGNFLIGTATDAGYKLDILAASNKQVAIYTPSSWTGINDYVTGGVGWQISRPNDGTLANAIFSFNGTGLNNLAISTRSDLVIAVGGGLGASTEAIRVKNGGQMRFVPLAADPAGAQAGDVYYNSGTNKLRLYDGSNWVDLN